MRGPAPQDPKRRFRALVAVDDTTGCWLWTGNVDRAGYGRFYFRGRDNYKAHRAAYELFKGTLAFELTIDHLCKRPGCVNPEHLEAVPQRENTLRSTNFVAGYAARRTCSEGHELTPAKRGGRECKTCHRERCRRWREQKREAQNA